ncbi:hypothetical protein ACWEN3_26205 [Streptomyces sp. NPDC004561]
MAGYPHRMDVRMNWSWTHDGVASGCFDSVDEAAEGLAASARRMVHRYGRSYESEVMQDCVGALQHQMRTDAKVALAEGRTWSGKCGGVHVHLSPT